MAKEEAGDGGWMTSYEKAAELSKSSGKPILMDFTGSDWCGYCIKLHEEVFSKDEFKKWAAEHVILLELDFPHKKKLADDVKKQNGELQGKYKVRGFPTCIFVSPEGKELGRIVGFPGAEAWSGKAKELTGGK